MSAPILAALVSLLPNLLIAVHALAGWLKMRDRPRLLMLLVFGSAVVSSLLSLAATMINEATGAELVFLSQASDALTVFAVYAFFLFMGEFTPVRPWVRAAPLAGMLALWAGIAIATYDYTQGPTGLVIIRPPLLLLAIAAFYLVLITIIAFRFWQHSAGLVGLSRKRVEAIALGTTIAIASVIVALAGPLLLPAQATLISWVVRGMGLLAGVIYYLGFATPRWLRDLWTNNQRRRIGELSLATAGGRPPGALMDDALLAAIEVSGAQAGALALWNPQAGRLELQARRGLADQLVEELLATGERFRDQVQARKNRPIISRLERSRQGPGPRSEMASLMDSPMFLGDSFMGVIRLVADRSLVFEPEDAAIMQVLGAQAAVSIDTGLRLEEVRQEAERAGKLYSEAGLSLRERVSELRAVLSSMVDGLYAVDLAGRITLVNRVAAEMAGISEFEALGKDAAEVFDFGISHAAFLEPVLAQGEATGHQETVLRVGEDEIPVSLAASPLLDDDQRPRGAVIDFRDITAEKEVQRVKDEFIATVSHELRTPLTAILGYADLMLRGTPDAPTPRQKAQLQAIRNNGSRLLTLINDLLDLSKIEAGQVTLNVKPVALPNVVNRSLAGLQVLISNKKLQVETDIPINLPLALADFDRLSQILDNLLSNAIKFTSSGGSIRVSARLAGGAGEQPAIQVTVADTGVGIGREHLERIWDRFYQVESSATRRFGGTGLGLSIVKHLVEMHGGQLEAHSAGRDQGSTFSFTLPVAGPAPATAEQPARVEEPWLLQPADTIPQEEDLARPLVLVGDDDPYFVHILRTQLESEGYRIAEAHDGVEVLKLARELRPFAITLDVQLPRADGWSVLNQLKRDPLTQDIPVVILTVVDNRDFGMTLGATDYLVKPIDYSRLADTLGRLVSHETNGGASVLVVEDDDDVREMLYQALEQGPWHTLTARDGLEAMATLQQQKLGVVILDLMMPNMDGFEVLTRMRAHPELAKIPVIILTAKELTDEEVSFLNRTAQRLILKQGHRVDQLAEEVKRTLAAWRGATVAS